MAQDVDADSREAKVKAAIIYKLTNFATWPKGTFEKKNDPITLTILGNQNLFDEYGDDHELKIGKHELVVKFAASAADIEESHVVYVGANHSEDFFSTFPKTPEGVLSIGDSADFAEMGGMIQISIKNGKPVLKVNVDATPRGKMRIDAQVLEFSEIYKEP